MANGTVIWKYAVNEFDEYIILSYSTQWGLHEMAAFATDGPDGYPTSWDELRRWDEIGPNFRACAYEMGFSLVEDLDLIDELEAQFDAA